MSSKPTRSATSDRKPNRAHSEIRVITFGTFDLLHRGHLNLLERAKGLGDHLIVGVSTDEMNFAKKQVMPAQTLHDRMRMIAALRCVDQVIVEESLEQKRQYVIECRADVLVMGDDWAGKFDHLRDVCRVVYLPRTPGISTTEIKGAIREAPFDVAPLAAVRGLRA